MRLFRILLALAFCLSIGSSPVHATAYIYDYPWATYFGGGYSHWVNVCSDTRSSYPAPVTYGSAIWLAAQRAVDKLNDFDAARGQNLHYSMSASDCLHQPAGSLWIGLWQGNGQGSNADDIAGLICAYLWQGSAWRRSTCDIGVDTARFTWYWGTRTPASNQVDGESVYLHEFGHGLNAWHNEYSACVMYSTITPGVTRRSICTHDRDSFAWYYAT